DRRSRRHHLQGNPPAGTAGAGLTPARGLLRTVAVGPSAVTPASSADRTADAARRRNNRRRTPSHAAEAPWIGVDGRLHRRIALAGGPRAMRATPRRGRPG